MYDKGAEHFRKAANEKYLLQLFYEYKANKKLDTALECLKLILEKSPNHPQANKLVNIFGI